MHKNQHDRKKGVGFGTLEGEQLDHRLPSGSRCDLRATRPPDDRACPPAMPTDKMPTLPIASFSRPVPEQAEQEPAGKWLPFNDAEAEANWAIDEMATWVLPIIHTPYSQDTGARLRAIKAGGEESALGLIRNFAKSLGIYALASVALPLISLALAPFLTHYLSPSDYGALTILNTMISLVAGITQLGLASAFFRAYGYDYAAEADRRAVLATIIVMLCCSTAPIALGMVFLAPLLANAVFGRPDLDGYIALAGMVVFLQNLTAPAYAWLRAESRALFFSLLSIGSLLVTLIATIVMVSVFRWGVAGALVATACGYGSVVICMLPIILSHAGVRIRKDIALSMLAFGVPNVLNLVSYWVLQLSDRYLLNLFGSLEQTAKYSVAYTLGSAISVVVIAPFSLAWPAVMFTIAKRTDAVRVFRLIFRLFGMFLLLAAFGLSLVARILLDWLFPVAYHEAAPVIPLVAVSIVFFGIYYVFMVGVNITRKTWLAAVFTAIAAIVNIALNLVLIPRFGIMGAATSTLLAYIALAAVAYVVNQRIYPLTFEIGIFVLALFIGVAFYVGNEYLAQGQDIYATWSIHSAAFCLYGGCLAFISWVASRRDKQNI